MRWGQGIYHGWSRRQLLASPALLFAGGKARPQSNVEQEIRSLAEHAPLSMQFRGGSAAECREWQRAFTAKLGELLGPYQPPSQWKTITERTVDLEDHRREELLLRAEGHPDLPVYLLTPRTSASGKRPGVLALHGHGKFGYDPVAGIRSTPELDAAIREANYDYGLGLVRRGFVVARGIRLMLGIPEKPEFDHPGSVLYFKVDDIWKTHETMSAGGVRFEGAPHLIAHDLWMAFFRDSEDNLLALMSEVRKG